MNAPPPLSTGPATPESGSEATTDAPARTTVPLARDVVAVVAAQDPAHLRSLLDHLAIGAVLPGRLLVLTREDVDDVGPAVAGHHLRGLLDSVRVVRVTGDLSPQRVAMAALDHLEADRTGDAEYAWLLTERCRPSHRALVALRTAARSSRTAAVVAPKLRTAGRPATLLSVGYVLTRAGRWVPQPRVGEGDQGQYDDRSDVLATSSVGALLRVADLREIGGWADSLTSASTQVAADVDLGWRLHRAGRRVLLAPRAVVEVEPADRPAPAAPPRTTAQLPRPSAARRTARPPRRRPPSARAPGARGRPRCLGS